MYILSASTISYQPTFKNEGFSYSLKPIQEEVTYFHPDYSNYIPMSSRRRMSDLIKMSFTCASDCLRKSQTEQPGAILFGTGLGCSQLTKKFLNNIKSSSKKNISPTPFILSTHNTPAGQISLLLENCNYNMTYTSNSLSFELALIDAKIAIQHTKESVLVGAGDEVEDELYNLNARLNRQDLILAGGASFFSISKKKDDSSDCVEIEDIAIHSLITYIIPEIQQFLANNEINENEIDQVLYSENQRCTKDKLEKIFPLGKLINYQDYSGAYLTNSSFAMHYAYDRLMMQKKVRKQNSTILICNNFFPEHLGLILLKYKKAQ